VKKILTALSIFRKSWNFGFQIHYKALIVKPNLSEKNLYNETRVELLGWISHYLGVVLDTVYKLGTHFASKVLFEK
jgi:hypothetical protein